MKKSFLYVLSAALLLTLSLSGCPQDADDDDDGPTKQETVDAPTSDLSYIAYAFGEGIQTVTAVNNINLGDNELVIPAGKSLDLASEDVILTGFTKNSKIIAWGDGKISFSQDQKSSPVILPKGAKIIADEEFIKAHVRIDYLNDTDGTTYTEADWDAAGIPPGDRPSAADPDTAAFSVYWDQVVIIKPFEEFKEYKQPDVTPGASDPLNGRGYRFGGKYVAVKAPANGEITGNEVNIINEKAQNLCFYLAGEPVVFSFPNYTIDFSGSGNSGAYYKDWKPANSVSPGPEVESVFNYIDDNGKTDKLYSLVVAGDIDLRNGTVEAPGGLTVWGVLKSPTGVDTSKVDITGSTTPLTAWTVRLNGATFNSDVTLLGSIANTFGGGANFSGKTRITGASTFNGATFNQLAVFSGPVRFDGTKGETASVTFNGDVVFSDNAYIYGKAKFNTAKENRFYKLLAGLTFAEISAANLKPGDSVPPGPTVVVDDKVISSTGANQTLVNIIFTEDVTGLSVDGSNNIYHFPKNVTFEKGLTLKGNGSLSVDGNATFKGPVAWGGTIQVFSAAGGSKAVFENGVTIDYGSFAAQTKITGDAKIQRGIFRDILGIDGNASIGYGSFGSQTTVTGNVTGYSDTIPMTGTFSAGTTTIGGNATLSFGSFGAVTNINGNADIATGTFSGTTTIGGAATFTTGSFSAVFNANGGVTFSNNGSGYFAKDINASSVTFDETSIAYFGGTIEISGDADFGTTTTTTTGVPVKIGGNATFGTYSFLKGTVSIEGLATFAEGGSLDASPGANIAKADFKAKNSALSDFKAPSGLTLSGITLPGNGTISVPAGKTVSLNNGINITDGGSIGPTIVFSNSGLTLAAGAKLTLISSGNKYFDFIEGGAANDGFNTTNVGTLTAESFKGTDNGFVINARGQTKFNINDFDATAGSFTLNNAVLNLSSGGKVDFGGTGNMLIMHGNGNLTVRNDNSGSNSALNGSDVGKAGTIITTLGVAGTVLVSGTLGDGAYGTVGTLNVGYIDNTSIFLGTIAYSGTTATAGSAAANEATDDSGTEAIAVFPN
jgi:hypothetical protein